MKPLRAFPLPMNIGTDICQISRIYGILETPRATRFINRILTPEEQVLAAPRLQSESSPRTQASSNSQWSRCQHDEPSKRDPELWQRASFIAGRFAAKEAAIKAHSHRQLTFHDIIIERRGRDEERLGSGPPVARIRGEEGSKEDVSAMISISHDGDYATATCLSYDPSVVEKTGSRDKY